MTNVHHSAIGTRDIGSSLTFWRDGLGCEVLNDQAFEGPWPELFGGTATVLRSVFLGDPALTGAGIVELVELAGMGPPGERPPSPAEGFFLLSLTADLDEVLPRMAALGVGGEPVVASVGGVRLAVVHDPNGVRVELMDLAAEANLSVMSEGRV